MCGITARAGHEETLSTLLSSLESLEYRGYDSAGVAVKSGNGLSVRKKEGEVERLKRQLSGAEIRGEVGIGHTRWSTHGPPSDRNAHPHTDCSGTVAVVHNGIIENHTALRERLRERGHEFTSETDSEVVPHLVTEYLNSCESTELAFRRAISELEGTYAIAMILEGEQKVYASRQGSPLVMGIGERANYLASDVPAFIEFTDQVVYLQDGDVAVVSPSSYRISDLGGEQRRRPVETVEWAPEAARKGGHEHYMIKEIHEQPSSLQRAIESRIDGSAVTLDSFPPGSFSGLEQVRLVACGTSYHAALYGAELLSKWGVPATAHYASEFANSHLPLTEETLVVGVTQSGETADTLEALRLAQEEGIRTLALTNVVGSTAARQCDDALFIRAGPEIGVAATKTFSSQVATMLLLGERLVRDVTGSPTPGHESRLQALKSLPDHVESVVHASDVPAAADRFRGSESHFFIGRGTAYGVALEAALKFKEITYEHAEGFPAGELKHGPLALVTEDTPVFAICTGHCQEKLRSNVREIQTRGGPVVAVAPESEQSLLETADETLTVPETHPDLVAVLANVQLQLLSYHTAVGLDRPIDKPRNLAKSVTVE